MQICCLWAETGTRKATRNTSGISLLAWGFATEFILENHRPDVAVLLKRCDVFVLPTLADARPRSIIEAMSLGIPVVSTAVGGIPTLIQDGITGLLVPPSDPAALWAALNRLALSPELRKCLGEAAYAKSAADCRPELTARRFIELYQRLLCPYGPGSAEVGHRLDATAPSVGASLQPMSRMDGRSSI